MVKDLNTEQFDELLKGDKTVVCDFYATWCGPCRMLAPVIDGLSESYEGKAEFVKVDIDKNMELAARYGIMSIPLVGIFKNGELVKKNLGYMAKAEADEFIKNNI